MMGTVSKYEWIDMGSSFVPSELSCAFLLAQLEGAPETTRQRLKHYAKYQEGLKGLERHGLYRLCVCPTYVQTNAHIFFLVFHTHNLRQVFQDRLKAYGVASFTHYVPLHSAPAGRRYGRIGGAAGEGVDDGGGTLPVTDEMASCLLRLPVWADMSPQQVDLVINSVKSITEEMVGVEGK